jgi:hypothetical protein
MSNKHLLVLDPPLVHRILALETGYDEDNGDVLLTKNLIK